LGKIKILHPQNIHSFFLGYDSISVIARPSEVKGQNHKERGH